MTAPKHLTTLSVCEFDLGRTLECGQIFHATFLFHHARMTKALPTS